MKYSFTSSNSNIRKRAAEIQKENTWPMIGAMVITAIISGLVSGIVTFISSQFGIDSMNPTVIAMIVIAILSLAQTVISVLLSLGYSWASLASVDTNHFKMTDIFKAFTRRPFRNFFAMFIVSIIITVVTTIVLVVIGGIGFFAGAGGLFTQGIDSNQTIFMGIAIGLLLLILITILTAWINLMFFAVPYLPYDFNQLSAWKTISISRRIMKGNKFKVFRLIFYYSIMMLLVYLILIAVVTAVSFLINAVWVVMLVGLIAFIAMIVITIRLILRMTLAQAVFYRTLITENEAKLATEIPELELTYADDDYENDPSVYHTENRPNLAGDAVAVNPNVNNSDEDENYNFVKGAGAATIFTAATSGLDDESDLSGKAEDTVEAEAPIVNDEPQDGSDSNIPTTAEATELEQTEAVDSAIWSEDIDEAVMTDEAADTIPTEDVDKKPYDILGYNTPDRTDFGKVNNEKEVRKIIKSEEKDDGKGIDSGFFNEDDEDNN